MKTILVVCILISTFYIQAQAEEFIFYPDKNKSEKIKIQRLDGMHVNEKCLKEKTECLKVIAAVKKNKVEMKKEKSQAGNPASLNCEAHQGQSEILTDKQNNEYDYCLLEKKYLVDSWDLMK